VQEVRRRARAQAASERAYARRVAVTRAQIARRRPARRSAHALSLDERDLARPPTRAELYSQLDDIAARIVATGGGIEEIVEATDLRTRENVYRSIDPAILVPQHEVLLVPVIARVVRVKLGRTWTGRRLAKNLTPLELIPREVDLNPRGKAVPHVRLDAFVIEVHVCR